MKVWKINTVTDDKMLEYELNRLEQSGRTIKEVLSIGRRDHTTIYKIIYTEEDVMETEDVSK
jgi:hypothetical protein